MLVICVIGGGNAAGQLMMEKCITTTLHQATALGSILVTNVSCKLTTIHICICMYYLCFLPGQHPYCSS